MRAKLESANAKREHQKKAWALKRNYKRLHKAKLAKRIG